MRTVVAGVALLLATVAGCSSDEPAPVEVGPLASASAGASAPSDAEPSASTTSDAPSPLTGGPPSDQDSELDLDHPATVEGASAFAREYVQLIGRGFAEADSAAVRERTAPGCEGCEALIGAMNQAAADGLRRRGGDYQVTSVATPPFEGGDVLVLLTYVRTATEIIDKRGNVVDRAPAVPETTVQMRLVHDSRSWRTQGYRVV